MMSFIILYIIIENHKITFHGFIHFNYTQSGNVKRYEASCLRDIPNTIEIYNVDPDIKCTHYFSIIPYPPPPGYLEVQGFTEGTAHWTSKISYEDIEESLIPYIPTPSYTPPKGYILSDKGIYTYTYNCAKHQIVGVGCTDFKRLRKDTRQKIVSALSKVEDTTL